MIWIIEAGPDSLTKILRLETGYLICWIYKINGKRCTFTWADKKNISLKINLHFCLHFLLQHSRGNFLLLKSCILNLSSFTSNQIFIKFCYCNFLAKFKNFKNYGNCKWSVAQSSVSTLEARKVHSWKLGSGLIRWKKL